MAEIKTRLNKAKRMLARIEEKKYRVLERRIIRLGYEPQELFKFYPFDELPARKRLEIFLEYEECESSLKNEFSREIEYACTIYPETVIEYIEYVLEDVGIPSIEELEKHREYILEANMNLRSDFEALEHKWRNKMGNSLFYS